MAAVTPSTLIKSTFGDWNVYLAIFAGTVDTADTWASGISGATFWFAGQADSNTTQASAGVGATYSGTTFTFALGEDNTAFHLMVLAKG